MEKSTCRSRILAPDMVIWSEGWYAREDEKTINYFYSSSSSPEVKFLDRGCEVAQETWPPQTSSFKKVSPRGQPCHCLIHVQSSPPKNSWPQCKPPPDKSVTLGQSNFRSPLEFMTGGLLHHSVKHPWLMFCLYSLPSLPCSIQFIMDREWGGH